MLGGCVSNNSSSTELSSETPVSSESTSIETSSSSSQQTITPIAAGSVGGSLIEIDAGDYLLVDSTYTCSFSPSDCEDKQMTAEYDTSIIKVEFMENSKTVFKITALKEGSTYLMLRSVELDCLVFRQKVTCKNEIAQKEIEDFVFSSTDKWLTKPETKSLAGSYKLVVTQTEPLECTMEGASDLNENVRAIFTATYKQVSRINEFMFYQFTLECDFDKTTASYYPKLMFVSMTGCNILIYDNEGILINMFYPEEIVKGAK